MVPHIDPPADGPNTFILSLQSAAVLTFSPVSALKADPLFYYIILYYSSFYYILVYFNIFYYSLLYSIFYSYNTPYDTPRRRTRSAPARTRSTRSTPTPTATSTASCRSARSATWAAAPATRGRTRSGRPCRATPTPTSTTAGALRGHYLCNATCSTGRSLQGGVLSGGAGHKEKHM